MKAQAKRGDKVLWLNTLHDRNEVENGDVLFVTSRNGVNRYDVVWLEGYKSRNDDFTDDCLLGVFDPICAVIQVGPFSGPTRLTPAGRKWLDEQAVLAKLKETT